VQWTKDIPLEQEVWEHCKATDPFSRKGYQLNLNRFQGVIEVAEEWTLPRWSIDLWERTFVALEEDMLKGKGVAKLFLRPGPMEGVGGSGSTSNEGVSLEDGSLRSCLQNSLVISTFFLADSLNKRRLQIIVSIAKHLRRWHSQQSTDLRSADASPEFMKNRLGKQVSGST